MAETEVLVLLVEVLDHIQDNIVRVLAAVPVDRPEHRRKEAAERCRCR